MTPVFLRGCDEGSAAWQMGFRVGQVGWVVEPYGCMGCCYDPSECSIVCMVNDAGVEMRLCVQDIHMEKVTRQ